MVTRGSGHVVFSTKKGAISAQMVSHMSSGIFTGLMDVKSDSMDVVMAVFIAS